IVALSQTVPMMRRTEKERAMRHQALRQFFGPATFRLPVEGSASRRITSGEMPAWFGGSPLPEGRVPGKSGQACHDLSARGREYLHLNMAGWFSTIFRYIAKYNN